MKTKRMGQDVRYFETIDSTNREAKRLGEEGAPEGVLVAADEQTAGKGRSGRQWLTPRGSNIAMTLLLRPRLAPDRISMVTLVMGLAVAQAVRETCGLQAGIKWPNDVVTGGKKICGILTEMSAGPAGVAYVVVGVGINVNQKAFPEELADKATSLALALGKEVERPALIGAVMRRFEILYDSFLEAGDLRDLKEEYNSLLVNAGREVRVLDHSMPFTGVARGIDERGCLLVDAGTAGGEEIRKVYAGEVSVRGIYGYV